MIALDAGVLIAYLSPDDAQHTRALRVLTAEIDSGLVVNPLTLAEVLVSPTRSGLADRVLAVLADLEINEAPFPFDSATKLARLRRDCMNPVSRARPRNIELPRRARAGRRRSRVGHRSPER